MSTHYTPSNKSALRLIRLADFLFGFLVPLLLVLSSIGAWIEGSSYAIWVTTAAWAYILLLIGRRSGSLKAMQAHCALGAVMFFGTALWYGFVDQEYGQATLLIVAAFTFGLTVVVMGLQSRLRKLEAPGAKNRTAEFPGIYQITCKPNDRFYIGQTNQAVWQRWEDHKRGLTSGRHHNKWLQADWDIYRPDQFVWEVLEVVTDPVWLLDRERYWQSAVYDATKCYNPLPRHVPVERAGLVKYRRAKKRTP